MLEWAATPGSYKRTLPEGKTLGDKMQVWSIQNTGNALGKAGAVSDPIEPEPFLDAESILLGFAPGKPYLATGISRHGNFLQWGWSAPPSKMTPSGRDLFVNCICYIEKFDGVTPVILNQSMYRSQFASFLKYIITDPETAARVLPEGIVEEYKNDMEGLAQYYRENIGLLCLDNGLYRIDEELESLGFDTNLEVSGLFEFVDLLEDPATADIGRRLLTRYTDKSFADAEGWRIWLKANQDRMLFSDRGGYKFYVIPF
ncbi:MAG: hypothetical protein AB1486_33310 [Planctomycetota bacterium]